MIRVMSAVLVMMPTAGAMDGGWTGQETPPPITADVAQPDAVVDPPPQSSAIDAAPGLREAIDRFARLYPNGDRSIPIASEAVTRMNRELALAGRQAVERHDREALVREWIDMLGATGHERYAALRLLVVARATDPAVVAAITARLEADPAVSEIARALAAMGPTAIDALPALHRTLERDLTDTDREFVLLAIMEIAPLDASLLLQLLPYVAEPRAAFAGSALRHLTRYADSPAAERHAISIVTAANQAIRTAPDPVPYLKLLESLGPAAAPVMGDLLALYDRPVAGRSAARVRRVAADTLLAIDPSHEAVEARMIAALRGNDPWLAHWAARGCGRVGRGAVAVLDDLEPWLDAPYVEVRREVALAVALIDGRLVETDLTARPGDRSFRPRDPFTADGVGPQRTYDLRTAFLGRLWEIWNDGESLPFELEIACNVDLCRVRPVLDPNEPLAKASVEDLEGFCEFARARGLTVDLNTRARFTAVPID